MNAEIDAPDEWVCRHGKIRSEHWCDHHDDHARDVQRTAQHAENALTEAERAELRKAVDRATLATTSQAAVAWGMPLLDILATEGHTDDCDALASENLTLCDCWWARVRQAAQGLSEIATAADDSLSALGQGDLIDVVEMIIARRLPPDEEARRG